MNRIFIVFGCIFILSIFSSNVGASIISPTLSVETTITEDTIAIFIGQTELHGTFYGYQTNVFDTWQSYAALLADANFTTFFDTQLLENLHAFSFFGMTTFQDVDHVRLINITRLEDFSDYEDLLEIYESIQDFTNVNVIVQQGVAIFGTNGSPLSTEYTTDLALSGFVKMPVTSSETVSFLGMLSNTPIQLQFTGNSSLLYPSSPDTSIRITNKNGHVLWRGNSDTVYLMQDDSITITDDSSLHLLPVDGGMQPSSLQLSVKPSDAIQSNEMNTIRTQLQNLSNQLGTVSIPFLNENNSFFDDIIPVASNIINGGFILVNTSAPVTIDRSIQHFSNIGFARSDTFNVILPPANPSVRRISGDFRLVFLGDHFYSPQAPQNNDGVAIPLLPVLLWISAVIIYLLFHFLLKSKFPNRSYPKIKRVVFVVHLAALFLAFILMDHEVSYQFGSGMFDILFSQGFNIVFLGFLGIDLLLFCLGYIACALPTSLLINQVLKYFGFEKETKGIGKAVGALMIWIFAAVYTTIILNVLFLFIQLPTFNMPL